MENTRSDFVYVATGLCFEVTIFKNFPGFKFTATSEGDMRNVTAPFKFEKVICLPFVPSGVVMCKNISSYTEHLGKENYYIKFYDRKDMNNHYRVVFNINDGSIIHTDWYSG